MCPDHNNDSSKKDSTSSPWATAAALAGGAAFLAGKAMFKGAKWAGTTIGDNARTLYQTVVDDKQKLDEIKRIKAYCTEVKAHLEKEQEWRERAMTAETAHYGELCQKVRDNLLSAQKYKLYYDENRNAIRIETKTDHRTIDQNVSLSGLDVAGVSLSRGGIAGAAAGSGAAALMAALGTASTGTAISSLSGAAFTNALLASFGGGSIASGGLGIAGGTVVLGSIIAIPALAVGGYMADKQVNKVYQNAIECEANARTAASEGENLFQRYDEGIRYLRKLNSDFDKFSGIFKRTVNLSAMAATYPKIKPSYDRLLDMSVSIAVDYMNIALVDEHGKIIRDVTKTIAHLQNGADECYKRLILLEENMTPEEERLANSVPDVMYATFETQVSAYQEEIKRLKEMNRQQDLTIKENNKTILHKDHIIAAKDRELEHHKQLLKHEQTLFTAYAKEQTEKLNEAFAAAAQAQSEEERMRKEYDAIKKDRDQLKSSFPESYDDHLKRAKALYANIKSDEIFEFIATGELNHAIYLELHQGDHACIAVEYTKAVEAVLYEVIKLRLDPFAPRRQALGDLIYKYIEPPKYHQLWQSGINLGLIKHLKKLRDLRNASAHKEIIDKERMQKARMIVLGGGRDPLTKDGLLKYFDDLLK